MNRAQSELFNVTWSRCEAFMRIAQTAFLSRGGAQREMTMPGLLGPAFRERLAAAMRIPVVEALFVEPWTAAARRALPSPSPQMTATAMWAPIIAWCALETLADSIDAENPEQVALEAFDQLRLRKPLAEAFGSLGFEGEAGWRAAARIKVVLLAQMETAKLKLAMATEKTTAVEDELGSRADFATTGQAAHGKEAVRPSQMVAGVPRALWSDPDVHWLSGLHGAGEYSYLVQEPFEELLWWLQMPALLRLAGQASASRADVQDVNDCVQKSLVEAKVAGYRLQTLLRPNQQDSAAEVKSASTEVEADKAELSLDRSEKSTSSVKTPEQPKSEPVKQK